MIAGGRQVYDGQDHDTFTAWAPHSIAVNWLGASDETGRVIGGVVDLAVGMLGVFYNPAAGARVFTMEVGGVPARLLQTAGGVAVVVADGRAIALTTEQAIRLALIMNAVAKGAAVARANPLGQLPDDQSHCGPKTDSNGNLVERTPEENQRARTYFKNHKDAAREAWEQREGRPWPTDADGNYWPAEHTPSLKSGGDPMQVYPRNPAHPDPHMIRGTDGLTDYERWGRLGTIVREALKRLRIQ